MEFFKSWKFMAIIFAVVAALAIAGVVYGVVTHEEPGLMEDAPRWEQSDFPLTVCPASYAPGMPALNEAQNEVANAAERINRRLGFVALEVSYVCEIEHTCGNCDINVLVGVPAESGWVDPGGSAALVRTDMGTSCDMETSNVHGELLDLTIQHELGHCLGLAHDDFELSIMRPVQSETPDGELPPRLTDFDRELLRGLYMPR